MRRQYGDLMTVKNEFKEIRWQFGDEMIIQEDEMTISENQRP